MGDFGDGGRGGHQVDWIRNGRREVEGAADWGQSEGGSHLARAIWSANQDSVPIGECDIYLFDTPNEKFVR